MFHAILSIPNTKQSAGFLAAIKHTRSRYSGSECSKRMPESVSTEREVVEILLVACQSRITRILPRNSAKHVVMRIAGNLGFASSIRK